MRRLVEERFWRKVDRRGFDDCWPWLESSKTLGYGLFWVCAGDLEVPAEQSGWGKKIAAHRVAFRLIHGHWPEPQALHGCDNPPCCNAENPFHAHEGTQQLNVDEMIVRGRSVVLASRFSVSQIEEMCRRNAAGESQYRLAEEFGTGQAYVSHLIRNGTFASRQT
jgi:hypothetical protein